MGGKTPGIGLIWPRYLVLLIAKKSGVKEPEVFVASVTDDSPAALAGISGGDIIKKIGEIEIQSEKDYIRAVKLYEKIKTPILFKINRYNVMLSIILKPKDKVEESSE